MNDKPIDFNLLSDSFPSSVFLLHPLTESATFWVGDNLGEYETFGDAIAVDHRYVADVLRGILRSGLVLAINGERVLALQEVRE
jgi:hypothetical protein